MGEYMHHRQGTWIILSKHAQERMIQRRRGMTPEQMKLMFDSILDYYHKNEEKFNVLPYNSEVFFFSRKFSRGVILAHRKDTRTQDDKRHFVLMTVYPPKVQEPTYPETPKFLV